MHAHLSVPTLTGTPADGCKRPLVGTLNGREFQSSNEYLRRLLVLALLSIGCLASSVVQAETKRADCQPNPACVALYEQAQQQSKAGNLLEALRLYKLAFEVERDSALLFSIGRVHHKLGQGAEAITYYHRFIDTDEDEAQKSRAREYLAQLEQAQRLPIPQSSNPNSMDGRRPDLPTSKRTWPPRSILGTLGIGAGVTLVSVSLCIGAFAESQVISSEQNRAMWWTTELKKVETTGQKLAISGYVIGSAGLITLAVGTILTVMHYRKKQPAPTVTAFLSAPTSLVQ